MSTKIVNLRDLSKEFEAFTNAHVAELRKATVSGVARSIPDLVEASPVDTGLYAQSWGFDATEESVFLGNYAPHAPIIEDGARPFTPPIGPLLAWAKRVLKDPSQPPDYSPEVWALARGTQAKIAKVGIQPRNVMKNMIPKILQNIKEEYERLG